jgi:hypothetical protein
MEHSYHLDVGLNESSEGEGLKTGLGLAKIGIARIKSRTNGQNV